MKYFYIGETTCSGDITTCCSDYAIAKYITIIQKVLNIIHFVVPIILILMATIQIVKLVLNPDDPQKKNMTSLKNKFLAAVFVYFVPLFVNILFQYTPDTFDISGCFNKAGTTSNVIDTTESYIANDKNYANAKKELESLQKKSNNTKYKEYMAYLEKIVNGESYQYLSYNDFKKHGEVKTGSTDSSLKIAISEQTKAANSSKRNTASESSSKTKKSSGSTKKGEEIANYAKKFVGNPYVWRGTSLTNGADCSGFTLAIYKHFGIINLPHSASAQSKMGKEVSSISKAQAGDLLFYQSSLTGPGVIGHVGIYDGKGNVIHASSKKTGIKISKATYKEILAIRRFI